MSGVPSVDPASTTTTWSTTPSSRSSTSVAAGPPREPCPGQVPQEGGGLPRRLGTARERRQGRAQKAPRRRRGVGRHPPRRGIPPRPPPRRCPRPLEDQDRRGNDEQRRE